VSAAADIMCIWYFLNIFSTNSRFKIFSLFIASSLELKISTCITIQGLFQGVAFCSKFVVGFETFNWARRESSVGFIEFLRI
jgi:hypothetical protein